MRPLRPPTAADLCAIAWSATGGDPTDPLGLGHAGDPERPDVYGQTKAATHAAALAQNWQHFERMARGLWAAPTRAQHSCSRRVYQRRDGKVRPIDVPPEGLRLVATYARERLAHRVKATGGLIPTIVGFRSIANFPEYRGRTDGITIQDVFAGTVQKLLREVGPHAIVVDLRDAFGQLPHGAIHAALRARGLCRADRARIVDLVKVHSRCTNGRVVRSGDRGIEQGNPASPLLFNVVVDLLFRQTYSDGAPCGAASYGDDVVLVGETEAQVRADFERFESVARALSFENVRPLDKAGPKSSRYYSAACDAVPLIKIFAVQPSRIALQPKHLGELREAAARSKSLPELRRRAKFKVLSKGFLMEVLGERAPSAPTHRPPSVWCGAPMPPVARSGAAVDLPAGGVQPLAGGGAGVLPALRSGTRGPADDPCQSLHAEARLAPSAETAAPGAVVLNDTVDALPLQQQHGPLRQGTASRTPARGRRTKRLGGGRSGSSCSTTAPSVSQLTAEHATQLRSGHHVRAGDDYRGGVFDAGIIGTLPAPRQRAALHQCARLASHRGLARLLVHPGDAWVGELDVLAPWKSPRWRLVRLEEHPLGIVVSVRRCRRGPQQRRPATPAPDAQAVIKGTRVGAADRRMVSVHGTHRGRRLYLRVPVDTFTPRDAHRAALAQTLARLAPETVAIPDVAGLRAELVAPRGGSAGRASPRLRLVSLAAALRVLQCWTWEVSGSWLLGRRSAPLPPATASTNAAGEGAP